MNITIKTELRPCYVTDDKTFHTYKGLFHCWNKNGDAIVEFDNGFCDTVSIHNIRFADNKMEEYNYANSNDKHKN